MKITISDVSSIPEFVTIRRSEYVDLKSKARRYDERRAKEQQHLKDINARRSQEERRLIAKKAAEARWSKEPMTVKKFKRLANKSINMEFNNERN